MFTYYPVTDEARRKGRLRTLHQRFPVDGLGVPFWPVLQAFGRDLIRGYPKKNFVAPSLEELQYTLAGALIAGADGLFLYTYRLSTMYDTARSSRGLSPFAEPRPLSEVSPRLWEDAVTLGAQARLLLDLLESAERVDGVRAESDVLVDLEVGAWNVGDDGLVLVANPTYEASQVVIEVPQTWIASQRLHATRFGPAQAIREGRVRVTVAGPGAAVLRLTSSREE